ncbi:MAG TPA: type II secretion system protein [Verrucomicrobiae bacterium]|jgi:prepilin-type processing-associated H-X9-DG protein|nr:type II secretion system protein [Verrucomicrobiae bacterium]
MKTRQTPKELRALTLIELLVVIVCIAILVGMLMPASGNPGKAKQASCQSNLKQIGIAYRTWDGDYGNKYPMSVPTNKGGSMEFGTGSGMFRHFQVMSNELNDPKVLICPADDRKWAADFAHLNNNNLSFFVGLDTDETRPAMILSGDRNLITNHVDVVPGLIVLGTNAAVEWSTKMHNQSGNFGLADGSVQKGSSGTFRIFISRTGTNVNRLAVP